MDDLQLLDTGYQRIILDPLAVSVILDAAGRVGGNLKVCTTLAISFVLVLFVFFIGPNSR